MRACILLTASLLALAAAGAAAQQALPDTQRASASNPYASGGIYDPYRYDPYHTGSPPPKVGNNLSKAAKMRNPGTLRGLSGRVMPQTKAYAGTLGGGQANNGLLGGSQAHTLGGGLGMTGSGGMNSMGYNGMSKGLGTSGAAGTGSAAGCANNSANGSTASRGGTARSSAVNSGRCAGDGQGLVDNLQAGQLQRLQQLPQ